MRVVRGGLAVLAVLLVAATPAAAEPEGLPAVYSYSAGTLVPPWKEVFAVPGRISVVPSPTNASHNVMRVELRGGDLVDDTARAEVAGRYAPDTGAWPDRPPTSRWYSWKTFLAPGFPMPGPLAPGEPTPWTVVTQWKGWNCDDCNPLFSIVVDQGHFGLHKRRRPLASWPGATTGKWHKFVVHMNWSPLLGGIVEAWHNGVLRYRSVGFPTSVFEQRSAVRPAPVYVQHGIYRDKRITQTAVLYHDTFRVGANRADVEP